MNASLCKKRRVRLHLAMQGCGFACASERDAYLTDLVRYKRLIRAQAWVEAYDLIVFLEIQYVRNLNDRDFCIVKAA